MPTFVSLLRGINVSGHRLIKMAELARLYESLGFTRVRTYVQSGNVLFDSKKSAATTHAAAISQRIVRDLGHEVNVTVLTVAALTKIFAANPLLGRPGIDSQFLHATFLNGKPPSDDALDMITVPAHQDEKFILKNGVVYLYLPLGSGKSKLSNGFFEKALGLPATTRNWRTVTALVELGRE